jgi:hypothetical protein
MLSNVIPVEGLLETVQQAKIFLQGLSKKSYQQIATPHFSSSAGAHMRHILDHYIALKAGLDDGLVNYNKRNRHSNVESCPEIALLIWQEIEQWLIDISQCDGNLPLNVVCETSIQHTLNTQTKSTLSRELVFVSSHAIHHFSLLAVIDSLLGNIEKSDLGIAPSTATYMRRQA